MAQALRDILARRLQDRFVGRRVELAALSRLLTADEGPLVAHVHGVAGIGKTTLLQRFAIDVKRKGGTVISLDCREIEPTERGFLAGLSTALGVELLTLRGLAAAMSGAGDPIVLVLDDYHHVYLADTWVRTEFVPALPDNARVVLGSREPPLPGWRFAPEWQGALLTVALGPFSEEEVREFTRLAGMTEEQADNVNRLALGHPLALRLATTSNLDGISPGLDESFEASFQRLAELHLSDVRDADLREALQAASVIRRVTIPLLSALVRGLDAPSLYERMRALPYVQSTQDGLVIHAAVQKALASSLRASDPERYRRYREAAWRELRSQSRAAGVADTWRYTADMIFILDNAYIREAFFPTAIQPLSTEQATDADWGAVAAIAEKHEPSAAFSLIERWWQLSHSAFKVMKGAGGDVRGFFIFVEAGPGRSVMSLRPGRHGPSRPDASSFRAALASDPMFDAWQRHLQEHPVASNETVVFLRRWLSDREGEQPSDVQGNCWLNIKQSYMTWKPHLRRCYIAVSDLQTYGPVASALGFRLIEGASADFDGVQQHLAVLDLGPNSVDGWLSAHIAQELGLDEVGILDLNSRELIVDGRRIHLTPLEFKLMRRLAGCVGAPVSRADLLESVWGYEYNGDSNVVDTLVAALRRKLGEGAALIETVWGLGYRLREEAMAPREVTPARSS